MWHLCSDRGEAWPECTRGRGSTHEDAKHFGGICKGLTRAELAHLLLSEGGRFSRWLEATLFEGRMKRTPGRQPLEFMDLVDLEEPPSSSAPPGSLSGDEPTLVSEKPATVRGEWKVGRGSIPTDRGQAPWDGDGVPIGSVIDGKYRVVGELGRGGMGIVVHAHDEHLDRQVAVKLIQTDRATPAFRTRFLEEARAMARVNHRNVVQIYASGEYGEVPYFVMELVAGQTMAEWLESRKGTVDLGTAVRMLTAVCEGVSAIHAVDTLHRDIKPSNILLDANLRPRIADLGVSTFCRSGHPSRAEVVGTPAYMAPEIAFPMPQARATPRADVYSLGCVAYELLTGEPPFSAENDGERLVKHATSEVRPPSTLRLDLPPEFDRVLLRALAKDPNERTPTVEAFRRELLMASEEGREPIRILIVEDDEEFRQVLAFSLETAFPDAEFVSVSNGRAAIEALREHPASVAVLDLNLPDIDAREVTRRVRAMESARHMPIIILTGWGGPAEWKQLLLLGADRFLTKPVSLVDLVTSVRHSLRERLHMPEPASARPPFAAPSLCIPPTLPARTRPGTNPG